VSLSKLPSGRWRAQVYDPRTGENVSVAKVLGLPRPEATFATKREAKQAREKARQRLHDRAGQRRQRITVQEFADRWTTDKLWLRPKDSTNITNEERIKAFVKAYGSMAMADVDDGIVAEYLAGAAVSTVPALRAMFNDAMSAKAGRLVEQNPFARLGLEASSGNRHKQPPDEEQVWEMVKVARAVACPSFAGWLQVAAFTGARPGELDALELDALDFESNRIVIRQQYNAKAKKITAPKNGRTRTIVMTPPAKDALLGLPRESQWAFTTIRGSHYTPSARAYHWKAVRAGAKLTGKTLYLCTRHFAGWYLVNVLEMSSEDVAFQLGHEDGGELVRKLYGHRDRNLALRRIDEAFNQAGKVRKLRVVRGDGA
jgi:integrase